MTDLHTQAAPRELKLAARSSSRGHERTIMAMKPETLERILFDRSLGELAPDVEALLQDYLEDRPQAGHLAEEAEQTVTLARRAVGDGMESEESDLPPPSFLHSDGRVLRWRSRPRQWLGTAIAAAMIVLAFWLGTQSSAPTRPSLARGPLEPRQRMATETTDGFWSVARLHQSMTPSAPQGRDTIRWRGPLTRPEIGEQS